MSKEPKRNVYVGHRYVPKIMGEWDKAETYEGLSIVTNKGTSYTSKKRVPKGIDILNEEYWVVTGNYNAQIEEYRKDVREMEKEVGKKSDQSYVDNLNEKVTTQLGHKDTLGITTLSFPRTDDELDDLPRLNRAIQHAKNNGIGRVVMPEIYYLNNTLEINHNDIILDGLGVGELRTPEDNIDSFYKISIENKNKVVIKNLTIDGNASNRNLQIGEGAIEIVNSRFCVVDSVTVKDLGKNISEPAGVQIYLMADENRSGSHCEYNKVINCTLYGDKISNFGIRPYTSWTSVTLEKECRFNTISGNRLFGFMWNTIEVAGHLTHNNVIDSNIVKDSHLVGIEADKGASYNSFTNNSVIDMYPTIIGSQGTASQGYRSQGAPATTEHPLRIAKGNVFIGNKAENINGTSNGTCGFRLAHTENVVLNGNTVNDSLNGVYYDREPCKSITVDSNNFLNIEKNVNHFGDGEGFTYTSIIISKNMVDTCTNFIDISPNSKDITITENVIDHSSSSTMSAKGERNNLVTNIKFMNNTIKDSASFGFYIGEHTENIDIIGNNYSGKNGVRLQTNSFTLSNNTLIVTDTLFSMPNFGLGFFQNNVSNQNSDFTRTRKNTHAAAMPTEGTWNKMDYVTNINSSERGEVGEKYIIVGWLRLTNGDSNVLNTDWFEDRMITGN